MIPSALSVTSWGEWKTEQGFDLSPCTSPQYLYPSPSPPSAGYDLSPGGRILTIDDCSLHNLYDTSINFKEDPLKDDYADFESTETKSQVASKILEDLDQWEHLDQLIKEEPLHISDWLEEKIELSSFDNLSAPALISTHVSLLHSQTVPLSCGFPGNDGINAPAVGEIPTVVGSPNHTQHLLQEFETVLGEVEMTHATLTPPQSPNHSIFTVMQPVPIQPDVAQELADVDELVRCRVEGLSHSSWIDSSSINNAPLSPSTSSSSGSEESIDDPDWIPETVQLQEDNAIIHKKSARAKPYSRPSVEDKKSRKKEQNKNAATRYRQKKKAEIEVILGEEKGLQDTKDQLESDVNDLSREIKYLKGLMRDLFKAKGLIQ